MNFLIIFHPFTTGYETKQTLKCCASVSSHHSITTQPQAAKKSSNYHTFQFYWLDLKLTLFIFFFFGFKFIVRWTYNVHTDRSDETLTFHLNLNLITIIMFRTISRFMIIILLYNHHLRNHHYCEYLCIIKKPIKYMYVHWRYI